MRSGDTSCLIRARGSFKVYRGLRYWEVLGIWGESVLTDQIGNTGFEARCFPARTDILGQKNSSGQPSRSGAKQASRVSTLLSEERSRPGRGAGQPQVTLSGTRIGLYVEV